MAHPFRINPNRDFARVVFDIETNGLLPAHVEPPFCMDKIHCLVVRCVDSGKTKIFINDGVTNNLREGVDMLLAADMLIGHNILDFDIPAIELIYPDFQPEGRIVDTLVMARMVFADVKESDFRMTAQGKLEGRLIGQQGLEAWGQRLGLHKGDYSKERKEELKTIHKEAYLPAPTDEELHHYTWGIFNQPMVDYCVNDCDVNTLLWTQIVAEDWSEQAIAMEHHIHALMIQQERNGFPFNVAKAEKLADDLRNDHDEMAAKAIEEIGKWYRPARVIADNFDPERGENGSRRMWGEVTYPKRTISYAKSNAKMLADGTYHKLRASTVEGAAVVKVELKEFNPGSRPQIIDRLKTLYGWEPQDFTEKGSPKVDDEILRALSADIPLAETLAEVFYIKKRLGQVADGKNGWLKLVRPDGRIHGRVNVGGTVSGRATHAAPNVSQVPGVNPVEMRSKEAGEEFIKSQSGLVNSWGAPIIVDSKWKEAKGEYVIYTRGRTGGYGWDSRELFEAAPGYRLLGTDLSGVEFRCLANLTFPFDDGELVDIVLNGDIHQKNADLAGISRSVAKRALYATMYGGGDAKLGSIIEPFASEARQKTVGKALREKLMKAMPSLKRAIREIHREMKRNRGRIRGLDGRWLYARSKHSALNLRLQSDGALIAKKWCLLTDDAFYEEGWDHGTGLEYEFHSWSHDETQISVLEELAPKAAQITEAMAAVAGDYFNFKCPIAAEAKLGAHWGETH